MANRASVSYAIEGPKENLDAIHQAICKAIAAKSTVYEEYKACEYLNFSEKELKNARLRGDISEEPYFDYTYGEATLRFWTEEAWGLQDFEKMLRRKFPGIKAYWVVEECGMEIYCTNDREGKYFIDRFFVDTCINDVYNSEYFRTKESALQWLSYLTKGKIKSEEDVKAFNTHYENLGTDDMNFIYIRAFDVV